MKLLIFGATGTVGHHLAEQALSQGHRVTAFARRPEKLAARHGNLKLIQGSVLDCEPVRRAVQGQDAVLCALGKPLLNREGLRDRGTRQIVRAMEQVGVRRLICLSALGAGESRRVLPPRYRYVLVPLFMRHLYADHERQESHVVKSGLDWVLVRPGNFTQGALTGDYRHGFATADSSLKLKISAADVAHFMLKQLTADDYLRRAAGLSY